MLGNRRKDFISLNLPSDTREFVKNKEWQRRSLWRVWNQLSRFQRSLLYVLVFAAVLAIIYIMLDSYKEDKLPVRAGNKKEVPLSSSHHIVTSVQSTHARVAEAPSSDKKPVAGQLVSPEEYKNILKDETAFNQINSPPLESVVFPEPSNERQLAVIAAFKHAWNGYKRFAWGHDHLRPITGAFHDWFYLGLTIVDGLDTMYIMGLKEEFAEARNWVAENLHFDINRDVNLFEVTIRVLGSLLSTYHLSGDKMFLDKAVDLGTRLLPCFSTESGVPYSDVNLATHKAHSPKWSPDSSTSEVTTIQLEFRDLSRSTGDKRFEVLASKVSQHVHGLSKTEGLVPIFINANTGHFRVYAPITLGARGDSYYEYLLKQWLQTGRSIDYLRDDYLEAIAGVKKLLTRRTARRKYLFIGELLAGGKDFKPKMDHLTCYLPGTLALGVHYGLPQDHMELAEELLNTCYQTYAQQPTFLAPEITYFNIQDAIGNDMYVKTNDAHNLLRPEFLESLWYMYQITGNHTYQDWGWQIFQAFEKHTKVKNGYTSIGDVRNPLNTRPKDMMESFFLSETLKYLYLLFSEDRTLLSIDRYVLNSEAHPLPIYEANFKSAN
ncbi:endoplasmic reticulum mannosyl-oligosaccharide 1,2-alpha-mannosidase isoform X1 [Schistocerca serialis cubense]|uniref:endoplasmic reticulum mannosyl-oligosaccharide 1,2-alpha-mannosidase isoform X1 n=2 Tax=Schistocerca serialis cubense TaxID=2023355 RepID=UPI00214E7886|nr:endoplasmic reticulum mannosyl-oligosaccharide 1,2-alpha-mannosidase isoform X1 [Schistocerca serialis cubense]